MLLQCPISIRIFCFQSQTLHESIIILLINCTIYYIFIQILLILNIMPTWVSIQYRIISTVLIKVQSIPIVDIFLRKSSNDRITEPRPQIILAGHRIILFSIEPEAVMNIFMAYDTFTKCIIAVVIAYPSVIHRIRKNKPHASLIIRYIMVVGSRTFAVGTDDSKSTDVSYYLTIGFFRNDFLFLTKQEF